MRKFATVASLIVLTVAAYLGLWIGLDYWGAEWVPPFSQPGRAWYAMEQPSKMLVLPAVALALGVWVVMMAGFDWVMGRFHS